MKNVYEEGDQDSGEGGDEHAELAINKLNWLFKNDKNIKRLLQDGW